MTMRERVSRTTHEAPVAAERILLALFRPSTVIQAVGRRVPVGHFGVRCALDMYPRPAYAYGVQQAVRLARRLGYASISVLEFGVASGEGLIELERMGRLAREASGVAVHVYGFDTGDGLPTPQDHRDVPYFWQGGFYAMDRDGLESRLESAQLVLGNVSETVPAFLSEQGPAPIGFVSFDLDYYSSTVEALRLFEGEDASFLPRVLCYFDNVIVRHDLILQGEHAGELLAIREFNCEHEDMKLSAVNGLAHKRVIAAAWNDMMYALHRFGHPRYGSFVGR